ncbi:YybH family protein [Amycolatopsis sp. NPDC051903]|uniref:YybH family protein n=1 Tax=Amycolatopsis sp. NPDC051903 TaxID=3363936 RepID=UPI0037988B6E
MANPMAAVLAKWQVAFDAHDADAIARLFTEDALFLGFGPSPTQGRDAVRAYYAALPATLKADFEAGDPYPLGDTVAGGFAQVLFHGPDFHEPVHLSLVLVLVDGDWRIRQYHVSKVIPRH